MSQAALVTGGGTGIGAAVARRLAADGFAVAVCGRRSEPLEQVAAEIDGLAVVADCRRAEAAAAAVAAALERFGRLDALVISAGISNPGTVTEQTVEGWQSVIDTNLTAAFLVARAALPHLLEQGGAVVAVSSLSALRAGPASAAYCASKAGLNMLVQSIAVDFGPQGVRANAVCPGWIRTEMADGAMDQLAAAVDGDREDAYRRVTARMPTPRPGGAEEVAELVSWLLSPTAGYINGALIPVDGGASLLDVGMMEFQR
jgi:meso-butanediol dehydrogenase / (S,S)-butanediol dehydrogenase / diacetyl reductase